VHFSQQNAECLRFADNSFDVVYSSAVLHETSAAAVSNILRECWRVLRPGGVAMHLEVPHRYDDGDLWTRIRGDYESRFNHEPFWHGLCELDLAAAMRGAGFRKAVAGFQDSVTVATRRSGCGFGDQNKGAYQCWFVASGCK
jgi:ubiquinone/menaquinone biosynthesis C-methylase UbiE